MLALCCLGSSAPGSPRLQASRPGPPEIQVAAAVSLTEAMQEIAAAFEKEQGVRVMLNLAASNVLSRQIVAGARTDVFISADAIQMAPVERAGLVRRSVDLLINHLVVLVAADSKVPIASAQDLLRPEIARISIGDPAGVPAGVYARQYLERAALWKPLEPKIVPTASVRAALAALESGNVDAAIVYRSDAVIARRARIAYPSPPEPVVIYPAALISSAPEAERFFAYLRSPEADLVFQRHGFGVPGVRQERTMPPKDGA
ncbi:MAG: molybdate ABC transporter substrate-binding protein [Vicinamibacterales bacterium]